MIGDMLLAMSSLIVSKQIPKMYLYHVNRDFVILRDGLRRYEKDKGVLPKNLNQLIPQYIKNMPTDAFAEKPKPYGYDSEQGLLWSVGEDGVDDMSVIEEYTGHKPENGFGIGSNGDQPHCYLRELKK